MSVFSALFDSNMYSFEQVFGVQDITTAEMKAAFKDWDRLYYQQEPNKQEDPCQRLPVAIVSKLTKTVFGEYQASAEKEGAKGQFISSVLSALYNVRKKALQSALIGGECFLKPVFTPKGVCFSTISRKNCIGPQ